MACSDNAIAFFLNNEGGYVNDPKDPGGETKYGISKKNHPNVDIKNLTMDGARRILYDKYWIPYRYKDIHDDALATRVFDFGASAGDSDTGKVLQLAISFYGFKLEVDGIIGSKTLAAVNQIEPRSLTNRFQVERCKWYQRQVEAFPEKIKYLSGWIKRACL